MNPWFAVALGDRAAILTVALYNSTAILVVAQGDEHAWPCWATMALRRVTSLPFQSMVGLGFNRDIDP